jgi:hypothetical protein
LNQTIIHINFVLFCQFADRTTTTTREEIRETERKILNRFIDRDRLATQTHTHTQYSIEFSKRTSVILRFGFLVNVAV